MNRLTFVFLSVDLMLETQLETLLNMDWLSLVVTVDASAKPPRSSVYSGLIAAKAGHPIIGRAMEGMIYAVAVENNAPRDQMIEMAAYLSRFFPVESLALWHTRFAKDINPLAIALHRSLDNPSPHVPLEIGTVTLEQNPLEHTEKVLFLLVSDPRFDCHGMPC